MVLVGWWWFSEPKDAADDAAVLLVAVSNRNRLKDLPVAETNCWHSVELLGGGRRRLEFLGSLFGMEFMVLLCILLFIVISVVEASSSRYCWSDIMMTMMETVRSQRRWIDFDLVAVFYVWSGTWYSAAVLTSVSWEFIKERMSCFSLEFEAMKC